MKTNRIEARLEKLFIHYNRKYWKERLPRIRAMINDLVKYHGICKDSEKEIVINVRVTNRENGERHLLIKNGCFSNKFDIQKERS